MLPSVFGRYGVNELTDIEWQLSDSQPQLTDCAWSARPTHFKDILGHQTPFPDSRVFPDKHKGEFSVYELTRIEKIRKRYSCPTFEIADAGGELKDKGSRLNGPKISSEKPKA